jgi:RHS repeat-associated protein
LIDQLVQKRAGSPVLTTTKQFDKLNRLSGVSSVSAVPSVVNSAAYAFNGANQRTRLTEADGKFWDFGYDALGQVTAGTKKLADSTPVLGHSFGYSFDTIGNLKTTAVNGQSATYAPDTAGLNQYASRTVPAALDIIGTADAGSKVAVNLAPAQRQGDLFYKQLPVANAAIAKWQPIDVLAGKTGAGVGGADADTRQSGHLFLAKTPESFTYDLDGNLTGDGQWTYIWDAENRLTTMETQASAVTAGVPRQKLEFAYDFTGRRIQKKVSNWNGTTYILASDTRFLYDGWNLLAEFNGLSSNAVVRSYVWGIDLSGSSQGAGGVGGLLAIHQPSSIAHLPCYDGNGNVTALIDSTTGARSATYVYGPFGESIAAYGPAAAANPFRFSTKYTDAETGQLYYGFRYYCPSTGRWLSRDPIEEWGGANMYGMCNNSCVGLYDYLGRDPVVVAGGTSVNDPEKHDQSGWNFLNTAVRRAIALEADIKGKGKNKEVVLVIYVPPYERRAASEGKVRNHYLRIVRQAVSGKGIKVVEIRASAELTSQLVEMPNASITSLDYFGHSDSENWFLEYSSTPQTNGTHDAAGNLLAVRVPANTGDSWGPTDAKKVPKSRFALGATVSSYGCNQGEPGGFADVVNKIWDVATKGSLGRTDYIDAGAHGGASFPASEQGYQTYPRP